MNAVYAIAILIGLAGILFAVINMIYPFKRLGIPTRKRGALVLAASFSLVIVAGVLIDPAKQTDQSEAIQPPPSAVDDEASTAADNRAPQTANSVTAADPGPEESSRTGVVTDRFTLQWELDGTDLLLAIDTDLPDTAEVIVFVDRRYYQVGDADAYSRDYFKEKVPISKWRSPRRIPLDDDAWKTDLSTHQSKMAVLGNDLAFEIDRIEDQIGVRALVHVNQPDQRFGGRGNPNLSGGAVSRTGDNSDWKYHQGRDTDPASVGRRHAGQRDRQRPLATQTRSSARFQLYISEHNRFSCLPQWLMRMITRLEMSDPA